MDQDLKTEARRLLREWLDGPDRSQSSLARSLALGQPSVSLWVRGRSRPESHHRVALEILTGIPVTAWDTPEERAVVERVRAAVDRHVVLNDAPPPRAA